MQSRERKTDLEEVKSQIQLSKAYQYIEEIDQNLENATIEQRLRRSARERERCSHVDLEGTWKRKNGGIKTIDTYRKNQWLEDLFPGSVDEISVSGFIRRLVPVRELLKREEVSRPSQYNTGDPREHLRRQCYRSTSLGPPPLCSLGGEWFQRLDLNWFPTHWGIILRI